jgi:hypothetical protein
MKSAGITRCGITGRVRDVKNNVMCPSKPSQCHDNSFQLLCHDNSVQHHELDASQLSTHTQTKSDHLQFREISIVNKYRYRYTFIINFKFLSGLLITTSLVFQIIQSSFTTKPSGDGGTWFRQTDSTKLGLWTSDTERSHFPFRDIGSE